MPRAADVPEQLPAGNYACLCSFSVLEDDQRRNRHNTVTLCQFRCIIHIYLDELYFRMFACEAFNYRCYHLAGTAPVCVEVYEYFFIACDYFIKFLYTLNNFHCLFSFILHCYNLYRMVCLYQTVCPDLFLPSYVWL